MDCLPCCDFTVVALAGTNGLPLYEATDTAKRERSVMQLPG
jgi:hypothetical protein